VKVHMLLIGPAQTGKSSIAKLFANLLGATFGELDEIIAMKSPYLLIHDVENFATVRSLVFESKGSSIMTSSLELSPKDKVILERCRVDVFEFPNRVPNPSATLSDDLQKELPHLVARCVLRYRTERRDT